MRPQTCGARGWRCTSCWWGGIPSRTQLAPMTWPACCRCAVACASALRCGRGLCCAAQQASPAARQRKARRRPGPGPLLARPHLRPIHPPTPWHRPRAAHRGGALRLPSRLPSDARVHPPGGRHAHARPAPAHQPGRSAAAPLAGAGRPAAAAGLQRGGQPAGAEGAGGACAAGCRPPARRLPGGARWRRQRVSAAALVCTTCSLQGRPLVCQRSPQPPARLLGPQFARKDGPARSDSGATLAALAQ